LIANVNDIIKNVDSKKTNSGIIYLHKSKEDNPKIKPIKEIADHAITFFILINSVNTIEPILLSLMMSSSPINI